MSIRAVQLADGRTRYRATVSVRPGNGGKRVQQVITGDTPEQVADQVTRLSSYARTRRVPDMRERLEAEGMVPATVLCADGGCTAMCLFALEDECVCRCRGTYHGRLAHLYTGALVDTGARSQHRPPPADDPAVSRAGLFAHHGLRAVRMHAGLTQAAVARATGGLIHPGMLTRAERGKYMPSVAQLLAIARVLGLGQATLDDVAAGLGRTAPDGRLAGGHIITGPGGGDE